MDFLIDPRHETFLDDHVVGGSPLLPTVLGLDLLVRSRAAGGVDVTQVSEVVVGGPVRFVDHHARRLVTGSGAEESGAEESGGTRWHVRDAAGPAHWSALLPESPVSFRPGHADPLPVPTALAAGVRAADLYPPHFHGPTFQVVGLVQPAADGLVSTLSADLPELSWSFGPLAYPARLLELVLQTCGVWHLADTGRLMVPAAIGDLGWSPRALETPRRRTAAHVWAQEPEPTGERLLSGTVTVDDEVVLTLTGYRTIDLGAPADDLVSRRFRRLLSHPSAREGVPA